MFAEVIVANNQSKNGPKWLPAKRKGKKVKKRREARFEDEVIFSALRSHRFRRVGFI